MKKVSLKVLPFTTAFISNQFHKKSIQMKQYNFIKSIAVVVFILIAFTIGKVNGQLVDVKKWTGTYPDNPVSLYNIRAFSVLETADHSGYVIAGDGENDSLLVLKTDTFGNILWTKKIQLGTNEFVQKIIQTSDGGFMVQGFTKVGPSASPYQLFLLKLEMEPTSIIIKKPTKISTVSLSYNYPNPFNPSTKIKYDLPKQENVKIEIFNLLGQKIETLVNKQMPSGSYEVEFTAKHLPSGVYLYRIEAGEFHEIKKMLLIK